MEPGEAPVLAETLALAFRDNPLNRAVIRGGPPRRLRSNRYGMRATLEAAIGRSSIHVPVGSAPGADGPALGGLIALPPGGWPLPPPPLLAQVGFWLGQGLGPPRRWGRVYRELALLHPAKPHWYLLLLGVGVDGRRRGLGSALLEAWLQDVDADALPAYLETDRRENLSFYGRAGFEVVGSHELLATPIWRMERPACRADAGRALNPPLSRKPETGTIAESNRSGGD
jgi:ribosomal protein S18 acetylase RimI-like enzyme